MMTYVLILLFSPYVGGAGPVTALNIPGFADETACRVSGNSAKEQLEPTGRLVSYACIPHFGTK